jgi:hypothetical protein
MREWTPERIAALRSLHAASEMGMSCFPSTADAYEARIRYSLIARDALPDALDEIERLQRVIDELDDMERL